MAKALIITEKPSVARDLTAALGGFRGSAKQGYWESEDLLCTFAVGHLLELQAPEDIDPAYKQWSLAHLPIVPEQFALKPIAEQRSRLALIRELAHRADVDRLINACDAAREGELIFREIVAYLALPLPIERLWLQSMTPEAIRTAFRRLRPGEQLQGLADAAASRAKSDWLIGMNATRAFSKRLARPGEGGAWSVGRVQTPTLALLVERELAILGHDPKPYFQIKTTIAAVDHTYEAVWFDPSYRRGASGGQEPDIHRDDRIFDRLRAESILADLAAGAPGSAKETRDQSKRQAPPLFDLTALQRQLATRYKWTAKRTLEAAQRCYETHKVITYPRTGSQCLPSDYEPEVRRLLGRLAEGGPLREHADAVLAAGLQNRRRIFDDAAVTDHFAIIPTGKDASGLSGDDAKLYDAVARRFVAAFFPPAVFDRVRRMTEVAGHSLRTGPVETLAIAGWMAVTGVSDKERNASSGDTRHGKLPPLSTPEVSVVASKLVTEATKPPPRINEAGLLSLMENAGRQVDDGALRHALMRAEGLGTPATRADIIQNLKTKGYVDQDLRPTFKGVHLIETLRRIGVTRLTSPELTARLELELAEVEQEQRRSESFMEQVVRDVGEVVAAAKSFDAKALYRDLEPLAACPLCAAAAGSVAAADIAAVPCVREQIAGYACERGCGFFLPKEVCGRYLDRRTALTLLKAGESGVIDGLAGKGQPGALLLRAGKLILQSTGAAGGLQEAEVAVCLPQHQDQPDAARGIAPCRIHGDDCQVIETRAAWMCTTRLAQLRRGAAEPIGTFLPKTVCGKPISPEDAQSFLADGSTGELRGFVSKAGRKFDARIIMRPGGAWAFDFATEKR